jgi:hypothetical protein
MAIALTVQTVHHTLRTKRIYLIATPSGNSVAAGDTVNLSKITPSLGQSTDSTVGYPGNIVNYEVVSCPDGYTAKLVKGATLATWLLIVYSAANTPLPDATPYPAGVTGVPFILMVEGPKGQL